MRRSSSVAPLREEVAPPRKPRCVLHEGFLDVQGAFGRWGTSTGRYFRLYADGALVAFKQEPHLTSHTRLPNGDAVQVQLSLRHLHDVAPDHLAAALTAAAQEPGQVGVVPAKDYGETSDARLARAATAEHFQVSCRRSSSTGYSSNSTDGGGGGSSSSSKEQPTKLSLRAPSAGEAARWCVAINERPHLTGSDQNALDTLLGQLVVAEVKVTLARRALGALVRQVSQRSERALRGVARRLAGMFTGLSVRRHR